MKLKLFACAAALACCAACIDIDNEVGENLIATNQQYTIHTAEFDLEDIRLDYVDALSGYSSDNIVFGAVRDARYGLSTRSCAFALVPVYDTLDFGTNTRLRGFHFAATADTVSLPSESQRGILQNVNVYELLEPLDPDQYYTSTYVPHGYETISKGVPVYNGIDTLSFDFTDAFAQKYLEKLKVIAKDGIKDLDSYTAELPGILIDCDAPTGYGGRINRLKLGILEASSDGYMVMAGNYARLKFRADYGNRKDVDTSFVFYFNPTSLQNVDSLYSVNAKPEQYVFNMSTYESQALAGRAKADIYIEGGTGLKPVVPAREIYRLVSNEIAKKGGNGKNTVIAKATIELPFTFPDNYEDFYLFPPILNPTLKRVDEDTKKVSFAGLTDANESSENQGDVDRSNCRYAPDISHHVQHLLKLKESDDMSGYDVWFLAMNYRTIVTVNSSSAENDYYQQMMYYSYMNSLYGGGYGGYSGYGYGGYGYDNYYSYMLMAQAMSSSSSSTTTTTQTFLDKEGYYDAILAGPEATGRRPKLRITYAVPKE